MASIQNMTLDIPYVKLRFDVEMSEDTIMPRSKVSALRGGMGEMLLRQNCVRDRKCEECRFKKVCVVWHTLYSSMEKTPGYVTGKESVGYLIECSDYKEEYLRGDHFTFDLILFGDSIAFFNQFLQAFSQLGMVGIGKNRSTYRITEVRNTRGYRIISENTVDMREYRITSLSDYISRRKQELSEQVGSYIVKFLTPLCMKYQGEFMVEFQTEALFSGILRRLQMLNYYESYEPDIPTLEDCPEILSQTVKWAGTERYSSTQDAKMKLRGIKGEIVMSDMSEEYLDLLLVGELIHIGKNTSFGFGKYIVKKAAV